jgi:hypothetical protein
MVSFKKNPAGSRLKRESPEARVLNANQQKTNS